MQIEIWSDLICPWCYIGKRRLESALAQVKRSTEVKIIWRSFELDPNAPTHLTETLEQMLARKYAVTPQQAFEMNAHVSRIAALVGLQYDLPHARPGNTFAAHRLVHYATSLELGEQITERLMHGYFCESLPIGEIDALVQVANEIGMNSQDTHAVLNGESFAAEVRADEQLAARLRVRGVPFFLFNGREGISGAQATNVFEEVIARNN